MSVLGGVIRRTGVVLGCVRSPADAWLAARMAAWRLCVPVLKRVLPLPRLAQLMWRAPRRQRDPHREQNIITLVHALSGPRGSHKLDNCLDRSLVAYRFLSEAGAEPEVVVGVAQTGETMTGHAWIRLDGEPWQETHASADGFEEMAAFGTAGALTGGGAPSTTPPLPDRWR